MQKRIFLLLGSSMLILLLPLLLVGNSNLAPVDNNPYDKEWIKVDAFIEKGLPKSALEIVDQIYQKARNEVNQPQLVKTVLYKIQLMGQLEEDSEEKSIQLVLGEIKTGLFPSSALFHSIVAELYWNYYQSHRYLWLNRTVTLEKAGDDIKSWDLKKLVEKLIGHHLAALKGKEKLQAVQLKEYDILLEKGKDSKKYRPTLYDFLAFRAVERFKEEETYLTKPADQFRLDNPSYLSSCQDFVKVKITTGDSLSLRFYALTLLQELIAFHKQDNDPAALIDADLTRLEFVYQNLLYKEKDALYDKALVQLEQKFLTDPSSTEVAYQRAKMLLRPGFRYADSPSSLDNSQGNPLIALAECENAIKRFPNSGGAKNCKILVRQIREVSLGLTTDNVVLPDEPILGLLNYKNVKTLNWRIIPIDPAKEQALRQKGDQRKMLSEYLSIIPAAKGQLQLPDQGDMLEHKVQIPLPSLPVGFYVIVCSPETDFDMDKSPVCWTSLWSSRISYVNRKNNAQDIELFILDRQSGKAMKGVTAEAWTNEYDYKTRTRKSSLWKSFVSDKEGSVVIPGLAEKASKSFYLVFKQDKDQYITDDYFYLSYYNAPKEANVNRTFLFTDRAIYRPGQTIYFKGIILEGKGNDFKVSAKQSTTVSLYDVNGKKVSENELVTNEFGSFTGTFTAPVGVLNGAMRISNENGSTSVQVEEYKRPRYEVNIDPLEGDYKLGSLIKVNGKAASYAGSPVDGAMVTYRVVRYARFPYWYNDRGMLPSSPEMEITNGRLTTNSEGVFSFTFTAVPDEAVAKSLQPVFRYEILVDVTDLNGEVRSATTSVSVSYTSVLIVTNLPTEVNSDVVDSFTLHTTNLAGRPLKISGKVLIFKLKQPDRQYRPRKWSRPDQFLMEEAAFRKTYPNDLYDDEDNMMNWAKQQNMVDRLFSTPQDSVVYLKNITTWPAGTYLLDVNALSSFGDTVNYTLYFAIYSCKNKQVPVNSKIWLKVPVKPVEPGQTAGIMVGSNTTDAHVLFEILRGREVIGRKWVDINKKSIDFPVVIQEADRGNLGINVLFIKDNRCYQSSAAIHVPYTNKELSITFETFRYKLQPGQHEEWKINISGDKKEKVAAELLLSMYDASLDAFKPNHWPFNLYYSNWAFQGWVYQPNFTMKYSSQSAFHQKDQAEGPYFRQYDKLIMENLYYGGGRNYYSSMDSKGSKSAMAVQEMMVMGKGKEVPGTPLSVRSASTDYNVGGVEINEQEAATEGENNAPIGDGSLQAPIRSDFRETAFFFPQLQTNEQGDVSVSFTLPESLTRWKVMGLAHSKDLKIGTTVREAVAQKELMVFPNIPRFFREGDKITFSVKLTSLSDQGLSGNVSLQLFDALTMKPVDKELGNSPGVYPFSIEAGKSSEVSWKLNIPSDYQAITYRIRATAGNQSDGEESSLPVLKNSMLVTESLSLPVKGKGLFTFNFKKLQDQWVNPSSTLKNHKLTLEFTANPAWYAIQALPYLMEYPQHCSEQIFNRYYSNRLASFIAGSDPEIKRVFEAWSKFTPSALLSNLEKNQDLKSLMLEETPWIMDAEQETERKQRIALLFDLNTMANETSVSIGKLLQMQTPNGGWPWFPGMPDDRYITQYIISGFGHLAKLGVLQSKAMADLNDMISRALTYIDQRIQEDYNQLVKYSPQTLGDNHLNNSNIQYLYTRSFFIESQDIDQGSKESFAYYKGQARKFWTSQGPYMQGMIALALARMGDSKTPTEIIRSLRERAQHHPELGMYWKDVVSGYYWHQGGIATQSLLIEAFDEISQDSASVEEMKIWLLKQKQTRSWKTTKATADACYALLLKGVNTLNSKENVDISLGNLRVQPGNDPSIATEAGSGYFRTSWQGKEIVPQMGKVSVTKTTAGIAWGAVYWQYFENLDRISPADGPLKIDRQLFIQRHSPTGVVIEKLSDGNTIQAGDKITVRLTLSCDRDLEYVHMKDMRAAGFEPLGVLSGYNYREGVGYYETTRDAASHFFFSFLPKGKRIFEYTLVASQKGDFSQGVTTVECMYAPEFSAHSDGFRIKIE